MASKPSSALPQTKCPFRVNVALTYARSFLNKIDETALFLEEFELDMLCASETWPSLVVFYYSFLLPLHFNAVLWDRPTRGGGIAIIIRNNISFSPATISAKFKHIEIVCIDVLLLNESCRFIVYYRSCSFGPEAVQNAIDSIACLKDLR